MNWINRCLLIFIFFIGQACWSQQVEPLIYLSASEKALVTLALKNATTLPYQVKPPVFLSSQPKEVNVNSFGEFIQLETGKDVFLQTSFESFTTEQLNSLLKPVVYKSLTPSVQRKIDRYYLNKRTAQFKILNQIFSTTNELRQLPEFNLVNIEGLVKTEIEKQIQNFSVELNSSNSNHVKLLSKLLKLYFKYTPLAQKAKMLFKLLELPINAKPMDVFLVMVQNSGPQMQKLMQVIGRHQDIPASFQSVFQKLESQVQEVPWSDVHKLLVEEGVDLKNYTYFERKPIGVGTMAQTHRVQYVNSQGQRVSSVLRFLKPGIEGLVQMDNEILKKIALEIDHDPELIDLKIPSLEKIISDLHESVVEELQLSETVKRQMQGRSAYNSKKLIRYSRIIDEIEFYVPTAQLIGQNKRLMEQELVVGSKVSTETENYRHAFPDLYKATAEKVAELWFEQVMFKTGFFHADLHMGNILMRYTDQVIKIYILDFGMTGQLNEVQRKSALLLALAIKFNNADLIAKHFDLLSDRQLKSNEYNQFLNQVKARAYELSTAPEDHRSLEAWVLWGIEQGIILNYEFLKLNRGLTTIKSMLSDAHSELTIDQIAQKVALSNKAQITRILINEKLFRIKDIKNILGLGAETTLKALVEGTVLANTKSPARFSCEALILN